MANSDGRPGGRSVAVVSLLSGALTTEPSTLAYVPLSRDGNQRKTLIGNLDGVDIQIRGVSATTALDALLFTTTGDGSWDISGVYHGIYVVPQTTPGSSGVYVDLMY